MSVILKALAEFVLYAVLAAFAQNAVLSRALGVSHLVRLVDDGATGNGAFCLLLTVVQVVAVPMCWGANQLLTPFAYRSAVRPLVFLLITTAACGLVWLVYWLAWGKKQSDDAHKEMGTLLATASFNSCVLGTMLIVTTQSLTLASCRATISRSRPAAPCTGCTCTRELPRPAHYPAVSGYAGAGHLRLYRPYPVDLTGRCGPEQKRCLPALHTGTK